MVKQSKSLVKSALAMSFGTLSSRVLGLVRDVVVSSQFSVVITDAWFVAFKIPNLLRRVFGEGAFSASFIPQFVDSRKEGNGTAQAFNHSAFTALSLLLMLICVAGIFLSEPIIHVLTDGKGFTSIPGKIEATVRYSKIMFFFLFFISIYAYFMAVLNTLKDFFWPAFVPVFFNLSVIVFALMPQTWTPYPGDLLSFAVVFGGFLQMAFLLYPIWKKGYLPKPSFRFKNKRLLAVFRNMVPGIVTIGILQFTMLVNVRFASEIANGANSWIYYADRLMELPLSLISVSLGTVLLPSLSEALGNQDQKAFNSQMLTSLSFALFLAIPSAAALYFLAEPLITTLFYRGEFRYYDVEQTAKVLQIYSFSLLVYVVMKIINSAFYASKKYWFPTTISFLVLIVHFFLVQYLIPIYSIRALPMSIALSAFLGLMVLILFYQIKLFSFPLMALLKNSLGYLVCSLLMVTSFSVHPIIKSFFNPGEVANIVSLFLTIGLASTVYLGFAFLFKIEQAEQLVATVKRKLF